MYTNAAHRLRNVCAIVSTTNCYVSRDVFKFPLLVSRLLEVHTTMGVDITVFWIVIAVRLAIRRREVTTKKMILRRRLITFRTKQNSPIDEPLDYPSSLSSTCLTILLTPILLVMLTLILQVMLTLILLVTTTCILLMIMFLCFGVWVIQTATAFPQHHYLGDLL